MTTQISMTNVFVHIVMGFQSLTNLAKIFIIDVWKHPKYICNRTILQDSHKELTSSEINCNNLTNVIQNYVKILQT